jgi:hypothetical protein
MTIENDEFVQGFERRNAMIRLSDDRHVCEGVAHREVFAVAGAADAGDFMRLPSYLRSL